jgi:AcrR family transcriptional regulator
MSTSGKRRHEKRARTTDAILDAAEKLFSAHGFAGVSVRDIGAEAGVSHALVHRYLGSKQDIYRAVLKRNEDSIRQAAGDADDLAVAISRMVREGMQHRRPYLRIVAHSALSGLPFDATMGRFPATERLIEIAEQRAAAATSEADRLEPRFAVAAFVSLFVGWTAMEPWVLPAAGLDDLDEEAIIEGLERVLLELVAHLLPEG